MATLSLKRSRPSTPDSTAPMKRVRMEASISLKPVRFLIMSDTHSAELPSTLPECDVLLHCGDLTDDGSPGAISEALEALSKVKAELKLVIAGNHEISLDKQYYLSEGGSLADIAAAQAMISPDPTSEASKGGVTFLSEGTHTFRISSGATFSIYASPYTPEYGTSGFQYPTNEDRFNPPENTPLWAHNVGTEESKVPSNIDIVMTHGPPKYILDSTSDGRSAGCEHLRKALERVKPKLHCFGHIHKSYGAQRIEYDKSSKSKDEAGSIIPIAKEWVGKNQAKKKGFASLPPGSLEVFRKGNQTLCINAAMEGEDGQLENAPWVVDLDLKVSE
ncbi:Metallophos-domain-containing protein [Cucurbitaria berberidis CBS 394.84]|uniref:Metallophos-domain-containing protein n=1 Tax=Cucurbitaria berberidis CBS 394.84 TaxID=1168544 RepID=A0A9P4G9E8_9PLEO|nr:Metallophos-domain-containing protein [Cucurbitaria berberidis CBS 394.84]KAF1841487.1 Metallophos-domain-containing protein [Cucurbitaria berberidis CBS 394.84]